MMITSKLWTKQHTNIVYNDHNNMNLRKQWLLQTGRQLMSQPVTPLCLNRDPIENVWPGQMRTGNIHNPYLVNPSFSQRACCSIWPNFKSKKCLPLFYLVPKNFFFAAPLLALIWRWWRYKWKQNVAEYISVCGTLCDLSQSEQV